MTFKMKIAGAPLPIVGRIPVKLQQNVQKAVGEAHTKNLFPTIYPICTNFQSGKTPVIIDES